MDESPEITTLKKKLDKQWEQDRRDQEFAQTFGTNSPVDLLGFYRMQIGVLERQIADERMISGFVVAVVAIACTILGRIL